MEFEQKLCEEAEIVVFLLGQEWDVNRAVLEKEALPDQVAELKVITRQVHVSRCARNQFWVAWRAEELAEFVAGVKLVRFVVEVKNLSGKDLGATVIAHGRFIRGRWCWWLSNWQ